MGRDAEGTVTAIFQATVLIFAGNVEECHAKYESHDRRLRDLESNRKLSVYKNILEMTRF